MAKNITPNPVLAEKMDKAFFGHPKPLSSMFMTELWERFSYYGLRAILVLFLSATLDKQGMGFSEREASAIVGVFAGCIYIFTIPGGWIADHWLGQVRSVWYGAILIAAGNLCLAFSGLYNPIFFAGLILIVLGSGLFKTCISVMVGSLYKPGDIRRDGGFSLFYMGINIGAFIAPFVITLFQESWGWRIGFGASAAGMIIALVIFRLVTMPQLEKFDAARGEKSDWNAPDAPLKGVGRWVLVFAVLLVALFILVLNGIIPINPLVIAQYLGYFTAAAIILYFLIMLFTGGFNSSEKVRLVICLILLLASSVFWSVYEQMPTTLNIFAKTYTNLHIEMLNYDIPAPFFQSVGPLFVIIFAPVFSWFWGFLGKRGITPTSFSQFAVALFIAAVSFYVMKVASDAIVADPELRVSPAWLILTYFLLTLGELCLSPVGLATMTVLAPAKVRGQMMGLWFAAAALGNVMAGLFAGKMDPDKLETIPALFVECIIILVISGAVLFLLGFFFKKQFNAIKNAG